VTLVLTRVHFTLALRAVLVQGLIFRSNSIQFVVATRSLCILFTDLVNEQEAPPAGRWGALIPSVQPLL